MLKLLIQDDEGHQTVVPLVRQEITIGRQSGNAVRLTERNVSRRHARLVRKNGAVLLEDLRSSNGTQVNGQKLRGHVTLKVGDQVRIGDYQLLVRSQDLPSDALRSNQTTLRLTPNRGVWRKWVAVALALGALAVAVAADRIFINSRPMSQREAVNELTAIAAAPGEAQVIATQASAVDSKPETQPVGTTHHQRVEAPGATADVADTPSPLVRRKGAVRRGRGPDVRSTRVASVGMGVVEKANPEHVRRLYEQGTDLLLQNQLDKAVTVLNHCLALDPAFAKCHRMLGSAYARQRNPEQGAIHYRRFVQLAPNDPEAPKVRVFLEQYEATRGLSHKD